MVKSRYVSLARGILKSGREDRFDFVRVLKETEDPERVKAHDHMLVGDRVCHKSSGKCGIVDAIAAADGRPDGKLHVLWDDGGGDVLNRFDVRLV